MGVLGFALGLIGGLGAVVFVLLDLRPEVLSVIVPPGILLAVVLAVHVVGRRLDAEGRRELARNAAQVLLLLGAVVASFFIALSGSAEFGLLGVLLFVPGLCRPLSPRSRSAASLCPAPS